MTNKERWDLVTRDLEPPQVFLDFAWYFTVACALERRVWFGSEKRPCHANIYVLFVSPPGIGKGVAMREAYDLLSVFPFRTTDGQLSPMKGTTKFRPLFYALPDATTFEKLVEDMQESKVTIEVKPGGPNSAAELWPHSSAFFLLEEIASLLRENKSGDVARFLLQLYDCTKKPYEYRTKSHKCYIIEHGCLNMIAGTNPDYLQICESSGLLGEGMFSRMFILYGEQERHVRFHYGDIDDDQVVAQKELQLYVSQLSQLYGQIIEPPEVKEWLQQWWVDEKIYLRQFQNSKLMNFFSRRKVQVIKLAMALHFGESTNMEIPLETWQLAAGKVRELESYAIRISRLGGGYAQFPVQERMLHWLGQSPRTMNEIIEFLRTDMSPNDITETIAMFSTHGKLETLPDGRFVLAKKNGAPGQGEVSV